jgi:hypothetical protein
LERRATKEKQMFPATPQAGIFAHPPPMPPHALPATVTLTCYRCSGEGELVDYRGPESRESDCRECGAGGTLTFRLALIDGDCIGYCEETGELLALSCERLLEGLAEYGGESALARWTPDVTRSGRDRYLLAELAVGR